MLQQDHLRQLRQNPRCYKPRNSLQLVDIVRNLLYTICFNLKLDIETIANGVNVSGGLS